MPKVYLAGPILGVSYEGATNWRGYAKAKLAESGIDGFSPLRYKEHLKGIEALSPSDNLHPLTSRPGIIARDRNDIITSDAVLFNLLEAKKVSIGTMVEYGWADAFRKPIVTVIERDGNVHDHDFVRGLSGFVVEDLDKAIATVRTILLP